MRHANAFAILLLGLMLAGCGGGDDTGFDPGPPVGKHVLYVADTDGATSNTEPKDELSLADTGVAGPARRIPVAVRDGGMVLIGPADADRLSYLVARDSDGCDAEWRVDRRALVGVGRLFLEGCFGDLAQSRLTGRIVFAGPIARTAGAASARPRPTSVRCR